MRTWLEASSIDAPERRRSKRRIGSSPGATSSQGERSQAASDSKAAATRGRVSRGRPSGAQSAK